jgi:hypothetical protein
MRAVSRPSRATPRTRSTGIRRPSGTCWIGCTCCHLLLPSSDYYWDSHGAKYRPQCKACTLAARKRR